MIALQSPSQTQIEAVKEALKIAGIPASVRVEKGVQRVYGSISIRPTKKVGYNWNPAQTLEVIEIARQNGLYVADYAYQGQNNNHLVYQPGLDYTMALAN